MLSGSRVRMCASSSSSSSYSSSTKASWTGRYTQPKGQMFHDYMASLPRPIRLFIWSGPPMSMLGFLALNRAYYFPSYYPMLPTTQSVEVVPTLPSSKESDALSSASHGIGAPRRMLFGVPVVAILSSSTNNNKEEGINRDSEGGADSSPPSMPVVTGYVHA